VIDALALPMPLTAHAEPNDPLRSGTRSGPIDAAAFGAILEREGPVLLAAARAILLDDVEAHDLVQATFELAWKHRQSLRDPGAARSWLLTIQAREAFRWRRRLARFVRLEGGLVETPAAALSAADSVAVRDALRTLSPRVRAAVVLHHMAGLPVAEVAGALGVSPNTIKTQLRLGLARLREELGDG
jgi:RNA polymerase sigma-70 factor (ECF subfamily)